MIRRTGVGHQATMTWEDIDLARKVARVAAARAKGRKTREVVLLDPAVSVLRALPRHIKSRFVFWHRDGARFRTARLVAKHRPRRKILALSTRPETARRLALVWGVIPLLTEKLTSTDAMLERGPRIAARVAASAKRANASMRRG